MLKAAPGAELACRAHNLPQSHPAQPRGIISYYATLAVPGAATVGDWLARIEALAQADAQAGRLTPLYRPHLQVVGNLDRRLPGQVCMEAETQHDLRRGNRTTKGTNHP